MRQEIHGAHHLHDPPRDASHRWRISPHTTPARRGCRLAGHVLACLLLLLLAAACTPDHAQRPAEDEPQASPGDVLVVAAERRRALASFVPVLRDSWCEASAGGEPPVDPAPVMSLSGQGDGPDTAAEPFALAVMRLAAASVARTSSATTAAAATASAPQELARLLDGWAVQGALLGSGAGSDANTYYALDRTLLPVIASYAVVRRDPGLGGPRRDRIDGWLRDLVALRGRDRPQPEPGSDTARNNHAYLRASVDMAWGALMGDGAELAEGVAAYDMALADMRPDGSLPLETKRGARALWYQRHAIASLVTIAEMAAVQGVDLYGRSRDGRSLHRAIRFLLDAIDDPKLVWAYAAADEKSRVERDFRDQDLSFLAPRGHGRHYMAWTEPYMARFPDRPETRRLQALLLEASPERRPMIDDYSGGNTTCLYAPAPGPAMASARP